MIKSLIINILLLSGQLNDTKIEDFYKKEQQYVEYHARVTYYWGDKHTATGNKPKQGITLAVDPKVIPYGSKVEIPGIGSNFIAHDTGPAVVKKTAAKKMRNHKAIVVDVFCKNKHEAKKLIKKHPHFIKIKVFKNKQKN